jgi:predicted Rossmann-fold nucleotide-binding protein
LGAFSEQNRNLQRQSRRLDACISRCHVAIMNKLRTVCAHCGSGPGKNPRFIEAATAFGQALAQNGVGLVYGGGSIGLMDAIAKSTLDHGGTVTGIIPDFLTKRENALGGA